MTVSHWAQGPRLPLSSRARGTGEGQDHRLLPVQGARASADPLSDSIAPLNLVSAMKTSWARAPSASAKDSYCQVAWAAHPVKEARRVLPVRRRSRLQSLVTATLPSRATARKSPDEPLPDRAAKFRAALDSWCEKHG